MPLIRLMCSGRASGQWGYFTYPQALDGLFVPIVYLQWKTCCYHWMNRWATDSGTIWDTMFSGFNTPGRICQKVDFKTIFSSFGKHISQLIIISFIALLIIFFYQLQKDWDNVLGKVGQRAWKLRDTISGKIWTLQLFYLENYMNIINTGLRDSQRHWSR